MIIVPVLAVIVALVLDFTFGDPKNKYHPTVWIGILVGKLVPVLRSENPKLEKLGGTVLVILVIGFISAIMFGFDLGIQNLNGLGGNDLTRFLAEIITISSVGFLLKTTIAIKGLEEHASNIMTALSSGNLEDARARLAMIVKRDTSSLDKQHIISATLESTSENIVDGITGSLFYFAIFGLVGCFAYRTVNTIDSMIGYKTYLFKNLGWFGANCDKVLNFVPSRLTSLIIILASMILGKNWRQSLEIIKRDGPKTESPNAGYPMAAMAGALGVKFEKLDYYTLGNETSELSMQHFKAAISLMKLTTILFAAIFTIPVIVVLSYLGWWTFV